MLKKVIFIITYLFILLPLEGYQCPKAIDGQTWNQLKSYFLPENHPIKSKLDSIFQDFNLPKTKETLKDKGFKKFNLRKSGMIVCSHPKLKGYIIKLFPDGCPFQEWFPFIKRIQGSILIQAAIEANSYQSFFKVPKKWIYPLPHSNSRLETQRNFILVVEDMQLCPPSSNVEYYYSVISKKRLNALFTVITNNLLIDSIFIDNIPHCLDGKIAFIDTEHFLITSIPFRWDYLLSSLNNKRRTYLQGLIDGK